ncbi:hypothetical protein BIV60_20005 [Bacillus sp. MUM 116]|uniref:Transmembrane protein n=1 Tax=Bacillus xiapuensis TaxID=2014075 RepID=A0ABU6N6R1_9BACI|nr:MULTISPECIES: hypothetical protein [Bacillus]MED3561713.1 hypothetical protein [Bacillus xiapuensis]OIK10758.1 hypothetical protein BIV60_20005 [Bacillus sp. MUM 116]
MKKLLIAFVLLLSLMVPSMTEAKMFSGGHSTISHSSSFSSHSSTIRSGSTYHSGYKSPSSSVSRSKSYSNTPTSKRSSFWSHAAAFGAGTLLGSMFHPFGYHNYGQSYGFSFIGLLVDILIIAIIIRVIKGIFFRRRY